MTALLDSIPPPPASHELAHKHLVDEVTWQRLVNRIVKEKFGGDSTARGLAERIMDQALGFLHLCALEPEGGYSPSPLVDIGWHIFLWYTEPYEEFCWRVAGRYIHHNPHDVPGVMYLSGGASDTVAAMRRRGLAVDEVLWEREFECGLGGENVLVRSDCGPCQEGNDCSDQSPATA